MATPQRSIVVRFLAGGNLHYDSTIGSSLGLGWLLFRLLLPGISIRPRIRSVTPAQLQRFLLFSTGPGPSGVEALLRTFEVLPPGWIGAWVVAFLLRLWPRVEFAYVQPRLKPAGPLNYATNPTWSEQGYLSPAKDGVDAPFAWEISGGEGDGGALVDVEADWLKHTNLPDAVNWTPLSGQGSGDSDDQDHGLHTLGIICASENGQDSVGIAPNIGSVRLASYVEPDGTINLEDAIAAAADALLGVRGAVILLEVELDYGAFVSEGCVDLLPATRDAIRAAVDAGIVVIEAAGNGGQDLSKSRDANGKYALNPRSQRYSDSGAILVGASTDDVPHMRLRGSWASNYGDRVDAYAWGVSVASLGVAAGVPGTDQDFGGTSAAAAIVGGVAVVIQALAIKYNATPFIPGDLRTLLRDPLNGTASGSPDADLIGVMPDLRKFITRNIPTAVTGG
jgi:microbial collagenase